MRKDWDAYFMDIAFMVAERGTCDRAKVGCVLVEPSTKRIKATGYNGAASGMPHCDDVGHYMVNGHCIRATHAEANCLNNADVADKLGATLYVTHYPCHDCQKLIISAGIKRVVYVKYYTPEVDWLSEAKDIEIVRLVNYEPPTFLR